MLASRRRRQRNSVVVNVLTVGWLARGLWRLRSGRVPWG